MAKKTKETREIGGAHGASCRELLSLLGDYVDGAIDPAVCKEMERHLAHCNPCQVVIDNIRKTITLYREGQPYELPVEFRNRLHSTLRKQWKQMQKEK